MGLDTISANLGRYQIGAKVRALRLKKNLGLVQLGAHTGLSSGMLSRIERDQLVPTLQTLVRIALVFGVGLEHFSVKAATTRSAPSFAKPTGCACLRKRANATLPTILRALIFRSATGKWRPSMRNLSTPPSL